MSKCKFEFPLPGSKTDALSEIRSHVSGAGGTFGEGEFALPTPVGTFRGRYEVVGESIVVDVTHKPVFVPCSAIESRLSHYVKGAR